MKLLNFLREAFADALNLLRSPEGLKSLYGVSLYRNAVYLMLTSGTTAVLGFAFFAFWVPCGLRPECPGRCAEVYEKAKMGTSESYVLRPES